MSGSSGDEAAQTLTTFLDGMPTPKERLNAAIRALLDERGQRHADTNLGAGSSQMGPGDEAVARMRAWLDEWSYKVQANLVVTGCGRNEADGCTELTAPDVEVLLDERKLAKQLLDLGKSMADRLKRQRDAATARAEQAEAEVERLKARVAEPIREAGSYRIGTDGDTADGFDWPYVQHLPCDQEIWSGRHANGAGLDVASLLSLIAAHHCGDEQPRQPHEPIRDQQDVDDLAAAPEDRLSPEEAAEFLKNIAECRGGEEGGNHGDA